ncbi:unnamed protein product [Cuscuta epithymum]|uniref:Reverse transcriptase Ty1/copia-type domain-containing protein n=1 Tax=Cuscuta epithymum TaxID=186058 RepID=A0AAV0DPY8_9ASTE|nr:unnamed protein product [Cuscuta epithymum]CAH9126031.1 unnamed protein product [Cuscuta epithymum]
MSSEFKMSMMGELNFFLGLQIKQTSQGTQISQQKYLKELLKKYRISEGKTMTTPMRTNDRLDADEQGKNIDQKMDLNACAAIFNCTSYDFAFILLYNIKVNFSFSSVTK